MNKDKSTREKEKIEQLLRPRYKVIADYPGIEDYGWKLHEIISPQYYTEKTVGFCSKYPHLFRKLQWWEERKPEEIPQYVKTSDSVFKVDKWDRRSRSIALCDGKWLDRRDILPATSDEYNLFLEQQKQNQ